MQVAVRLSVSFLVSRAMPMLVIDGYENARIDSQCNQPDVGRPWRALEEWQWSRRAGCKPRRNDFYANAPQPLRVRLCSFAALSAHCRRVQTQQGPAPPNPLTECRWTLAVGNVSMQ